MRVMSKGGQVKIIQRPIQHIYPLEVRSTPSESGSVTEENSHATEIDATHATEGSGSARPQSTRKAAMQARDRIVGIMMDDN